MTPFDAVLRIERRSVDRIRVAISRQADAILAADTAKSEMDAAIEAERTIVAADWTLPTFDYFARQRAARQKLEADRAAAEEELTRLRSRAVALYGAVRALECAADDWRENARREAEAKAQAEIDDFASSRFAQTLRTAQAARTRGRGAAQ